MLFLFATLFQTGCIGSFKLTNGLYDWNRSIGGKFAQELVFLAFVIIPVYSATLLIDAVILNLIEFWSGSNPVTMQEGDEEIQIVEKGGNQYQITATKNKFHVEQLTGNKAGQSYDLVFDESNGSWNLVKDGKKVKVADVMISSTGDLNQYNLYKPDGSVINIDPAVTSRNAVKAAVHLETASIE